MVCLVPLSTVLKKVKARYKLGKKKSKVNHLLFMENLKMDGKTEKELDPLMNTVRLFSGDIRMEFGINKCEMLVMK